jgi:hypothetical protein
MAKRKTVSAKGDAINKRNARKASDALPRTRAERVRKGVAVKKRTAEGNFTVRKTPGKLSKFLWF